MFPLFGSLNLGEGAGLEGEWEVEKIALKSLSERNFLLSSHLGIPEDPSIATRFLPL